MENIYGAAYYPEHWDRSLWQNHIDIMREYNIKWMRIGEFSWKLIEPEDEKYDFSLFDEAIELLYKSGINIIFGTPTAVPPIWLVKKYPEILPINENGEILGFGSRRHYCVPNKIYQKYALRVTEKVVERYVKYVKMWQIDNEFGCTNTDKCYSHASDIAFREWLKKKYKDIDFFNEKWGTPFWAQMYDNWEDINIPRKTVTFKNPHQVLDFYRFSSGAYIDFAKKQVKIIRKYSNAPITHNFMIDFLKIDYKKFSEILDLISWDNYITTEEYDPLRQAANHDLMRSLKDSPFIVMEQQPGRVNWRRINEEYPPSYLSMWLKQAYLHGSMGSLIFRFRELPYGAEQFHGALVSYDGRPRERLKEFSKTFSQLKGTLIPKKEVGIYFDYENVWIHEINHLNRNFSYWDSIVDMYKVVRKMGYNVDFVFSNTEINNYKLLIIPYAMELEDEFLERLRNYKGKLIVTAMSGIKDRYNWIIDTPPYGIGDLLDFKVKNFSGIKDVEISAFGGTYKGAYWIDEIEGEGLNVLGIFNEGPFKSKPAIFGKDDFIYIGTVPGEELFRNVMLYMGFSPLFSGKDVEVIKTDKAIFLLDLSGRKNTLWVGKDEYTLSGFELRNITR